MHSYSDALLTTTDDGPTGDSALIRARRSETGWIVSDCVTTRFGYGETLAEAFASWVEDLTAIAGLECPLGPPIDREAAWARVLLADGC